MVEFLQNTSYSSGAELRRIVIRQYALYLFMNTILTELEDLTAGRRWEFLQIYC
jgi:hypothetical protein